MFECKWDGPAIFSRSVGRGYTAENITVTTGNVGSLQSSVESQRKIKQRPKWAPPACRLRKPS